MIVLIPFQYVPISYISVNIIIRIDSTLSHSTIMMKEDRFVEAKVNM